MRRKRNVDQLSLLEKRPRWRHLPDDVRRRVSQLLASLLSETFRRRASNNKQENSHVSR